MTTKKPPAGTQFENKVRGSLKRIGFRDIDGGANFTIEGFQVDAVGGWDDVLLVIEATQTKQKNASIRDRIVEFRGKSSSLRKGFKESSAYSGYQRLEFALVTQGYRFSKTDKELADSEQKIHLLDYQVFEYYQKLAGIIGTQPSLFNLLGELGVKPQDLAVHRTPAFKVELQKNVSGYLFFCEPQKLLEIAYVARRETGRENYYQRMVTSSRLKNIKGFIDGGGTFANNVILAFDTIPQFRTQQMTTEDSPSWLEWGVLTFPKSYRAAWIIDGQHRLYAFGGDQPASRLQKLPVFAFEQLTESKQAAFFIEINKEQKPVSPDLIWDIEADLRPESARGRIALSVKRLNQMEPLKDRIYYPLSGDAKQGKLKISSICTDISDLRLLNDKTKNMSQLNPLTRGASFESRPARVANGIAAFLRKILGEKESATYRDDVILKPGGITLVLNVYEQVLIRLGTYPKDEHLSDYSTALVTALDHVVGGPVAARTFVKNHLTSYAQRREVIRQIINSMRNLLNDQNFGQGIEHETPMEKRVVTTERKLAKLVAATLGITTMKDLKQKTPETLWKRVQDRAQGQPQQPIHTLFTLGEVREIMSRKDSRDLLSPKLTGDNRGFGSEGEVEVALDRLIELRNSLQHGRTSRNPQLGQAYLSAFERVLEDVEET